MLLNAVVSANPRGVATRRPAMTPSAIAHSAFRHISIGVGARLESLVGRERQERGRSRGLLGIFHEAAMLETQNAVTVEIDDGLRVRSKNQNTR